MMTYVLFIGDMLVMAFMTALVVWVSVRGRAQELEQVARLPLDDEERRG
ncbi:MAG TPA: hypothetical protein VIN61_07710 [Gammaproteobacteria bacterium]